VSGNRGLVDEREASRHLQLGTRAVATGAEEDGGGDGRLLCCRNAPVPQWNLKEGGNKIQRACIAMWSLFVCSDTEGRPVHCGSTDGVSTRSAGSPFRCGAHDVEKQKEVRKEAATGTTEKFSGPF
jgi:hypothetical protein